MTTVQKRNINQWTTFLTTNPKILVTIVAILGATIVGTFRDSSIFFWTGLGLLWWWCN